MNDRTALIGFCGSRNLDPEWQVLVAKVIEATAKAGRGVAVGCCVGADALALRACFTEHWALRVPYLRVFAAFGPGGKGDWVGSATRLVETVASFPQASNAAGNGRRIVVNWWTGGGSDVDLVPRLEARTEATVDAVAASGEGRGLVAFVTGGPDTSPGTWGAIRQAIEQGVTVVVFPCGCSVKDFPILGDGAWVKAGKGIWAAGWRWVANEGTPPGVADESSTTSSERAPRSSCRRRNLRFPQNGKSAAAVSPPSPPAPTAVAEGIFDLLGWRELPEHLQGRTPSLPPLFGYGYRRWRPRRRDRETVETNTRKGRGTAEGGSRKARETLRAKSRPLSVTDGLLACAVTVLLLSVLVGGLSGALIPSSPAPKISQKAPALWAYHEHVKEQLHALATAGCVKATDRCLGTMFAVSRFPGGDVLTIENYHFHLSVQMVHFTDSECFIPSDRCLEAAYEAIKPPQ